MTLSLNPEQFLALFYLLQTREKILGDDNLLQDVENQMRCILLDLLIQVNNTNNIALYEKWKDFEVRKIQNLKQELLSLKDSVLPDTNKGIFSKKKNKF
jgi:hypothetical protein